MSSFAGGSKRLRDSYERRWRRPFARHQDCRTDFLGRVLECIDRVGVGDAPECQLYLTSATFQLHADGRLHLRHAVGDCERADVLEPPRPPTRAADRRRRTGFPVAVLFD